MRSITGGVTAPLGFRAGGTACGIKKNQQPDLALVVSEVPATAAGLFTTNQVQAAPVQLSKEHLRSGVVRAIIANSGNANACVGPAGLNAARAMAEAAAGLLGIPAEQVLVASTGVIGVELPTAKIQAALKDGGFIRTDGGGAAARAIMTTDTFPKEVAVELILGGKPVRIGGMAKGSGMIHPNMATMLGFITTDAAINRLMLARALRNAGDYSFNRVTVDGDTSTNDSLFVLANGRAGNPEITTDGPDYQSFLEGLTAVCLTLAKMLVRDGEGATKLVEVRTAGASSEAAALQIGKSVANSNLVKTALFGEDANWGRILAAVGYSGVPIDLEKIRIFLGDLLVCQNGIGVTFDEAKAKRILEQKEILIRIDLGMGDAAASVWTCDLSYDYVKINGSYRT